MAIGRIPERFFVAMMVKIVKKAVCGGGSRRIWVIVNNPAGLN